MSANAPAGTRGRKAVDPNETTAQKLARLAGARVTRAIDAIEKVGNVGVVLKQYGNETGTDVSGLINQMLSPIAAEFATTQTRLKTGETAKKVFELKVG